MAAFPVTGLTAEYAYGFTGTTEPLDERTAVFASGNSIVFFDTRTGTESVVWGMGVAVGAIAVMPGQKIIAFAEKTVHPSVFVVTYPEREVLATLRDGTEHEYSSIAFSRDGKHLAALGGLPDFNLCVWSWESMSPLVEPVSLEAASPGIGRVSFSPYNSLEVCVSGGSDSKPKLSVFRLVPHFDSYLVQSLHLQLDPSLEQEVHAISSHCWGFDDTTIYAGTDNGDVLTTDYSDDPDDDSGSQFTVVSRHHITKDAEEDAVEGGEARPLGGIVDVFLTRAGVVIACEEGSIRWLATPNLEETKCVKISENGTPEAILRASMSPSLNLMSVATTSHTLYTLSLPTSDEPADEGQPEIKKVADFHAGPITGVACLPYAHRLITSGLDGTVRSWDYRTHRLLWKLAYKIPITSMSVSPDGCLLATGNDSGVLRVYDATLRQGARMIFRLRLFNSACAKMSFDPLGNYLVAASKSGQLFFMDARLGEEFRVLGSIDLDGEPLSITWNVDPDRGIYQLFVSAADSDIFRFDPPSLEHQPDDSYRLSNADVHKALVKTEYSPLSILASQVDEGEPLQGDAMLETGAEAVAQNRQLLLVMLSNRSLVTFAYPEETGDPDLMDETDISPPHRTHFLLDKPGTAMVLSPDGSLVGMAGSDGVVRTCSVMDPAQCHAQRRHDPWLGGATDVAFSYDSNHLFSVGSDGLLLSWNIQNAMVTGAGVTPSNVVMREIPTMEDDIVDQDDEKVFVEQVKEDQAAEAEREYAEAKERVLHQVGKLKERLITLLEKNNEGPELERLSPKEFVIDRELRDKLFQIGEEKLAAIRASMEKDNICSEMIADRIKAECWDSMEVIGVKLKGFNNDMEVANYSLRTLSEEDIALDQKVRTLRKVELAEFKTRLPHDAPSLLRVAAPTQRLPGSESRITSASHQRANGEDDEMRAPSRSGAATPKQDEDLAELAEEEMLQKDDLLYDPFELYTPQRKMTQIRLLKNKIRDAQIEFNTEFERYFAMKKEELSKINERNVRIRKIVNELGIEEAIFEYIPDEDEHPENVLHVTADTNIARDDKDGASEDGDHLKDDSVDRALKQMMGGKLEKRSEEEALEEQLERPEWMSKPVEKMTEEEVAALKEFERKEALLQEERNKRRKALETELRKLQQQISEITFAYDERLGRLYQVKLDIEEQVNELELKVVKLVQELLAEQMGARQEALLLAKQDELNAEKTRTGNRLSDFKRELDRLQLTHEKLAREDKELERAFKRDFLDQPEHIDILYRLFRSRRRVAHSATQDRKATKLSNDPYEQMDGRGVRTVEQDPWAIDRPEGIDDTVWQRLIEARRAKMESEVRVRNAIHEVREAEDVYESLQKEDAEIGATIMSLGRELNDFQKRRSTQVVNMNIMFRLKQGQIEVDTRKGEVVTDYADALFIHRHVVQELNEEIVAIGKDKIGLMEKIKSFRKAERLLKWELTKLDMEAEDLQTRIRDYHVLRVTKDLQTLIRGGAEDRNKAEVAKLEKRRTQALAVHKTRVEEHQKQLRKVRRQINDLKVENKRLENSIGELSMAVVERQKIHDIQRAGGAHGAGARTTQERFRDVANMRRLRDIAKAQTQEITLLRQELRRLRLRTFPTFARTEYVWGAWAAVSIAHSFLQPSKT